MIIKLIPRSIWQHYVTARESYKKQQVYTAMIQQYGHYADFRLAQRTLTDVFTNSDHELVQIPVAEIVRDDEMEMPLSELLSLAGITQLCKPQHIFEFGTYEGASTLVMAQNSSATTQIYTLDLDPATRNEYLKRHGYDTVLSFTPGERFQNSPEVQKISQLYLGLEPFDFSPYLGKMDLVLVDADHSYEFVKADSMMAFKLIKPGGVIIWDDYTWKEYFPECVGVTRCVNELAESKAIYRIAQTRLAIYIDPS